MNPKKLMLYLLCALAVGIGVLVHQVPWWMKLLLFGGFIFLETAQGELSRQQKYSVLVLFAIGIIAGYGIKSLI